MRSTILGIVILLTATAPTVAVPVAVEPLRGAVRLAEGKPAGGAIVWSAQQQFGPLLWRQTVADAQGRYALKLSPGTWYVWARHGSQGNEGHPWSEPVLISAERPAPALDITLEERGILRGRLLEAETGKPIAGGKLYFDMGAIVTSDAQGRFEFGGLTRGSHESFVVAPGRVRMRVVFDTTARADTVLEISVPRAGKIVGRVTDLEGKPIIGAYVGRHTSGSYYATNALFAACDANGRFEYDDAVAPDQATRLSAFAPGFTNSAMSGVSVGPGEKPLELTFRLQPKPSPEPKGKDDARRVVTGVVLGPTEVPLAGATVRWGYSPHVGAIQARTDDAGRFRLTVPNEEGILAVLSRRYLPAFPDIAAGGNKEVVVRMLRGQKVRGQIVDDGGKPIGGVSIFGIIPSPDPRIGNTYGLAEKIVHTNAEGMFEMDGLPESVTFDLVRRGLCDLRNQRLKLDGEENRIAMQHGGAIKGRAVDAAGKPIRDFRVTVTFPLNRQANDRTDGISATFTGMGVRFTSDDGTFVLSSLSAGSVYRIAVLAEGHGAAIEDRVVAVATNRLEQTEAVTFKAGPPVALKVQAVSTVGKLISGARVALIDGQLNLDLNFNWGYDDASWNNMVRGRTGDDGIANFPSLQFRGATLLVQAPGYGRQRLGWRGGQKEMKVTLAPEAVIAGEVNAPDGKPFASGFVSIQGNGDRLAATLDADAKGRFRLGELPAGKWTIAINGDGRVLHQQEVELKAGEMKNVNVEIKPR